MKPVPAPDAGAEAQARRHQGQLTKPPGSLGRLEDVACWLAARLPQPLDPALPAAVAVFAADHGVSARGVSAYPAEVTAQMLANFAAGGAAINVLTRLHGCALEVIDVGVLVESPAPGVRRARVRAGTRDLGAGPALDPDEVAAAIDVGRAAAERALSAGARLLIAGEMGIGNTTAAACLICACTGAAPERIIGRGTGVDAQGLARKRQVVTEALARAGFGAGRSTIAGADPVGARRLLAELGGLEISAMAGFYLQAAQEGVPVLLDGFISAAAALCACAFDPGCREWLMAGHRSAEGGHDLALEALRLAPLIDLQMRLGEGSGAVLALPLLRAALAVHTGMATFAQAGVAGPV